MNTCKLCQLNVALSLASYTVLSLWFCTCSYLIPSLVLGPAHTKIWMPEKEAKLFLALMDVVSYLNQSSNPYIGSCCNAFLYNAKTVYSLSTWTCGNRVLWGRQTNNAPSVKCLMYFRLFQSCLTNRLVITMDALCNTFRTLVCFCLSLEYLISHTESKIPIDLTFESNNVTFVLRIS